MTGPRAVASLASPSPFKTRDPAGGTWPRVGPRIAKCPCEAWASQGHQVQLSTAASGQRGSNHGAGAGVGAGWIAIPVADRSVLTGWPQMLS